MKKMPRIEAVMTPLPHTIGHDIPIEKAREMMRDYHVRHLPVYDSGRLVGILSDRDIKLASSFPQFATFQVEDVMTPDPFCVPADAPLDQVLTQMVAHKYGCALVGQPRGRILGIFTAVDALEFLSQILKLYYSSEEN
ncbi:MAG: CBS domain-containing protein [Bdellovibrionia bacterium]